MNVGAAGPGSGSGAGAGAGSRWASRVSLGVVGARVGFRYARDLWGPGVKSNIKLCKTLCRCRNNKDY
jgi:hypothetical protein